MRTAHRAEAWWAAAGPQRRADCSDSRDVGCVQTLFSSPNLELNFLPFRERLESVHGDCRKVHEHVFAAFLLNEAVPLGIIEPLRLPSGHLSCLRQVGTILPRLGCGQVAWACGALYATPPIFCQENGSFGPWSSLR